MIKAILILVLLGSTAMSKTEFEKKFKLPAGFEKDFESRIKIKTAIKDFFKAKKLKFPEGGMERWGGFVTSSYRPDSKNQPHKKWGALDVAAGVLGPHQEDFVDFMLEKGFRVIDERGAVSKRKKNFERGIFHIDDHPKEKGWLRRETPQKWKTGDKESSHRWRVLEIKS
mgnify:FL=1